MEKKPALVNYASLHRTASDLPRNVPKCSFRLLVALCAIALLAIFFLTRRNFDANTQEKRAAYFTEFETCTLPDLDPWDPSIVPYLDPTYNPMRDCKPTFVPWTRMKNGRIDLLTGTADEANCDFRYALNLSSRIYTDAVQSSLEVDR